MRRTVAVVAAHLFTVGCVSLTPAGARVIDFSAQAWDVRGRCELLGLVSSGFKSNTFSDAQKEIRNKTAELGGDVFVIVAREREMVFGEPRLTAEAYQCGLEREPQPATDRAAG